MYFVCKYLYVYICFIVELFICKGRIWKGAYYVVKMDCFEWEEL